MELRDVNREIIRLLNDGEVRALADHFGVPTSDHRTQRPHSIAELSESLTHAGWVSPPRIFSALPTQSLHRLCRTLGIAKPGRTKDGIVARLMEFLEREAEPGLRRGQRHPLCGILDGAEWWTTIKEDEERRSERGLALQRAGLPSLNVELETNRQRREFLREMNRFRRDRSVQEDFLSHQYGDYVPDLDELSAEERRAIAHGVLTVVEDDMGEHLVPGEADLLVLDREDLLKAVEGRRSRRRKKPSSTAEAGADGALKRGRRPPFGYGNATTTMPDGSQSVTPVAVEKEAEVARHIFALAAGGMTTKDIASRLNARGLLKRSGKPWGRQEVLALLRHPAYAGEPHERGLEPIVDITVRCLADLQLARAVPGRQGFRPDPSKPKDLLVCLKCDVSLERYTGGSGSIAYYRCPNAAECGLRGVWASHVDEAINRSLAPHILEPSRVTRLGLALFGLALAPVEDQFTDRLADAIERVFFRDGAWLLRCLIRLHVRHVAFEKGAGRCAVAHVHLRDNPSLQVEAHRDPIDAGNISPKKHSRTQRRPDRPWLVYGNNSPSGRPIGKPGLAQLQAHASKGKYNIFVDLTAPVEGGFRAIRTVEGGDVRTLVLTPSEAHVVRHLVQSVDQPRGADKLLPKELSSNSDLPNMILKIRRKIDRCLRYGSGRCTKWAFIQTGPEAGSGYYVSATSASIYRVVTSREAPN